MLDRLSTWLLSDVEWSTFETKPSTTPPMTYVLIVALRGEIRLHGVQPLLIIESHTTFSMALLKLPFIIGGAAEENSVLLLCPDEILGDGNYDCIGHGLSDLQ